MELYQAYTDYNGMMDLTENLYRHVAQEVLGTTTITYNGIEMDLGKPFERITMLDAVKSIQVLISTKFILTKRQRQLQKKRVLSLKNATRRAISLTFSLKNLQKSI